MLRMDHYPYSRYWAIWDDQDLVAVVVYKKGRATAAPRKEIGGVLARASCADIDCTHQR